MVGSTSEVMESSGSDLNSIAQNVMQLSCQNSSSEILKQMSLISTEHSYAHFVLPSNDLLNLSETNKNESPSYPTITISEPEINLEETHLINAKIDTHSVENLDVPFFSNFNSPKSETSSSDLGYESLGSPYGSELSSSDAFSDLWSDTLSELFPELI